MNRFRHKNFIRMIQLLLGLLLVVQIVLIVLVKKAGAEAVKASPYAVLTVDGVSMEPLLHEGDAIFVYQAPYSTLLVGDVVVFYQDGELVTHEIVDVAGDTFLTKGLANDLPDAPLTKENYCAKMLFSVPMIGTVLSLYGSFWLFVGFAALIALLFYWSDLYRWIVGRRVCLGITKLLAYSLFLSVILLAGTFTRTKYTSYLNDHSHVVAQDFIFASNYLDDEEAGARYSISSWSSKSYDINLEIHNYENSLRFNKGGKDIYYKVIVERYDDENFTRKSANQYITYDVTYPTELVGDYVCLPGMDTYVKEKGTHNIKVNIKFADNYTIEGNQYIKITAMTRGQSESNYMTEYAAEQTGRFVLQYTASEAVFETKITENTDFDAVIYEIKCKQIVGSNSKRIRVYYNNSRLSLDKTMEYPEHQAGTENYIEFPVNGSSITKVIFKKKTLGDSIDENAIRLVETWETDTPVAGGQ